MLVPYPCYAVIDLPPPAPDILAAFARLPLDPYCGGEHRYRRFSQYKLSAGERERWRCELLPHRPFIQSKDYNPLVGGIARRLEPLQIDPSAELDAAARGAGLDRGCDWQVNVHQCRVVTDAAMRGLSVPEGPHRDGHEIGMIIVFARENIRGGETQLMPADGGEPFYTVTLQPNQAIFYDDGALFHYATDIEPLDGRGGHRDLWIVAFNRWQNRRYGPEFESRTIAS